MTRSFASLLSLIAATAACAHHGPTAPLPKLSPDAARAAAKRADPAEAADLAWLAGNDAAYALGRLDEALAEDPAQPGLLLRRLWIHRDRFNPAGVTEDLAALLRAHPDAPETEVAMALLLGRKDLYRQATLQALAADPVLAGAGDAAARPSRVMQGLRLQTDVASWLGQATAPATLDRAGTLRVARVVGPLRPGRDRLTLTPPGPFERLDSWPTPPRYRGRRAAVRTLSSPTRGLYPVTGGVYGLYVLETWIHVPKAAEAWLVAELGPGRVWVDDRLVLTHTPLRRLTVQQHRARFQLPAGWHRLRVATELEEERGVTVNLLGADGRPIFDQAQATAPEPYPTVHPPSLPPRPQPDRGAISYARARAADAHTALFGRLLLAELASNPNVRDRQLAMLALEGMAEELPGAAAVPLVQARLDAISGVPLSKQRLRQEQALKLDPANPSAVAESMRQPQTDALPQALKTLDALEQRLPNSYVAPALRFRLLEAQGWTPEAAQALRTAATRDPPPILLLHGAIMLLNAGHRREARALVAQARAGGLPVREELSYAILAGESARVQAILHEQAEPWAKLLQAEFVLQGNLQSKAKTRADPARALRLCLELLERDPLNTQAATLMLRAALRTRDPRRVLLSAEWLRRIGLPSLLPEVWLSSMGLAAPLDAPSVYDPWSQIKADPKTGYPPGLDPHNRWFGANRVVLRRRLVDRVLPNNSAISRFHEVLRLQTKQAADDAGELRLPGDVVPIQLRTLKTDGAVVPVSRHEGMRTVSFTSLAPGDATEQEWVGLSDGQNPDAGFFRRFAFQGQAPAEHLEYELIVPSHRRVVHFEFGRAPAPVVTERDGLLHYRWVAEQVDGLRPEPQAAPAEEFLSFITVWVDPAPSAALAAHARGLISGTQQSPTLRHFARELVDPDQPPLAQAQAVFRWVDENISPGGARPPVWTLGERAGRRDGLLAALLNALGIQAELVALRPGVEALAHRGLPPSFPLRGVRVSLPGGVRWAILDGVSPSFGRLPPQLAGGQLLRVGASGELKPQPIPPAQVADWGVLTEVELQLREDGTAQGSLHMTSEGALGGGLRRFLREQDEDNIHKALQTWLARLIPGAQLDSFEVEGVDSPLTPIGLKLGLTVPDYLDVQGSYRVREQLMPFLPGTTIGFGLPLQAYLGTARRETPLLLQPMRERLRLRLHLPPALGAPIQAPQDYAQDTPFGRFSQRFAFSGHTATLERSAQTPLLRVPAARFGDFRQTAIQTLQANAERLVFPHASN